MGSERKNIIQEIIQLSYFMRGGLQYADGFELNKIERSTMQAFLDMRITTEAQRPNPNY